MTNYEREVAVFSLVPDPKFKGCWYDNSIVWLDTRPFPTEEEIQAEHDRLTLETYKTTRKAEIRAEFDVNQSAPVECTVTEGTFTVEGGFPSVQYIKGGRELAERLGETHMCVTDINNIPHLLTIESVYDVCAQIGVKWREAFFIKQAALVEVDNL